MNPPAPPAVPVALPDGTVRRIRAGVPDREAVLSEWLESKGIPLNTRCGGRGLCNGCRVELVDTDGATPRPVRSCAIRLADLPGGLPAAVRVPEASFRDRGLHGVSVFELETDFSAPSAGQEGLGVAVDVGTTTVAAALWDLSSGVCLGAASRANEQARFGDNVLSRITFSLRSERSPGLLREALVDETLAPLLGQLLSDAGQEPSALVRATVAGNPVMLHALLGESLEGFARFPFRPAFLGREVEPAAALGLSGSDAEVVLLPGLGAFVGADIFAGALAAGLTGPGEPALLIDFGTNGEILLRTPEGFLATATAAGPAFEGGRLRCGSAARRGAVSSLERAGEEWACGLSGGGSERPKGIAGSAYVDFLAVARREGILNPFGRLDPGHPRVTEVPDEDGEGVCRRVVISGDLFVSESDVAELIQAKAAIGGGVATLLDEAGLVAADLGRVYVAGGFGYHLNPAHAVAVGLLPDVDPARIRMIGNSSLGGASLLLLRAADRALDPIESTSKVIELNEADSFEDHFTDALALAPLEA